MNAIRSLSLVKAVVFGALLAGCATPLAPTQSPREAKLPDAGPTHEYKVKFPDPGHGVARYIGITVGEDVAQSCGLVRAHFEFDSTEPVPQDKLVLESLASCLKKPELADVTLSLVGRADRRGNPTYNAELGMKRADRAKELLVSNGVAKDRISTSSRGASAAVGDDTLYSYGYDRRVDVVFSGAVHAPQ